MVKWKPFFVGTIFTVILSIYLLSQSAFFAMIQRRIEARNIDLQIIKSDNHKIESIIFASIVDPKKDDNIIFENSSKKIVRTERDRVIVEPDHNTTICSENNHMPGAWVKIQAEALDPPRPCCTGNRTIDKQFGLKCLRAIENNSMFEIRPGSLLSMGGHGCECGATHRDLYSFVPSRCIMHQWNASEFCRMLGPRHVLLIGDSMMQQTAAVLFNAVALGSLRGAPATPGTCQGQLHFGRSDTLVGRKTVAGAKHRGPRWTEHVRRLRPDLAVVSAGSHLSGPEQLSGNVDANKPTPPRL